MMKTACPSRRAVLRGASALAGAAVAGRALPTWLWDLEPLASAQAPAQGRGNQEALAKMRAALGAAPIEPQQLSDRVTMLSGPGGNVLVLHGPDGKVVVDTFVLTAWDNLKKTLDGMGNAPIKLLIDTHWHFDHTDGNGNFQKAGASIVAHENTKKRLSEPHDLLGMHFDPAPPHALPTRTFKDTHQLDANGEQVTLTHVAPAHTDTDIFIRYGKSNVMHLGDVFFNSANPFIDASTGGSIGGMINGANTALKMVDESTKIVPGHGPLGDRASLTKYRDVLVTARDRISKLKKSGMKLEEVVAAKPLAEFDATWGKGFMTPENFIGVVYNTL